MKKTLMAIAGIILLLLGCSYGGKLISKKDNQNEVKPVDISTYFISDSAPITSEVKGNPLRYAAKRIGFDLDSFELPRAHEGFYRLACRFPIIDYISNRPLYMKQWAEDTTEQINKHHREEGIETVNYALEVLREASNLSVFDFKRNPNALQEMKKELTRTNFTGKYQQVLLTLYDQYLLANELTVQAKMNLTEEDLKFFNANPSYFLAPDGKRMPSITGNVDTQFQFIERARRVAYEYIFSSATILAEAISDYIDATKSFKQDDFFITLSKANETFRFDTPNGPVIISGFGNDTHSEDSPFLIDLGGDDTYTNNAGGSCYTKGNIAICIDHSGNDYYNAP